MIKYITYLFNTELYMIDLLLGRNSNCPLRRRMLWCTHVLVAAMSGRFLAQQNWAVIGDVLNAAKPASRVVSTLRGAGKTVHLVNPRDKTGQCKAMLSDIEGTVDVVDLIINSRDGIKQVEQMVPMGISKIFIQPGAESDEILSFCSANSIEVFQGCVMVEFGGPH